MFPPVEEHQFVLFKNLSLLVAIQAIPLLQPSMVPTAGKIALQVKMWVSASEKHVSTSAKKTFVGKKCVSTSSKIFLLVEKLVFTDKNKCF